MRPALANALTIEAGISPNVLAWVSESTPIFKLRLSICLNISLFAFYLPNSLVIVPGFTPAENFTRSLFFPRPFPVLIEMVLFKSQISKRSLNVIRVGVIRYARYLVIIFHTHDNST